MKSLKKFLNAIKKISYRCDYSSLVSRVFVLNIWKQCFDNENLFLSRKTSYNYTFYSLFGNDIFLKLSKFFLGKVLWAIHYLIINNSMLKHRRLLLLNIVKLAIEISTIDILLLLIHLIL